MTKNSISKNSGKHIGQQREEENRGEEITIKFIK